MTTFPRRQFLTTAAAAIAGGASAARAAVTSPPWSGTQAHAAPLILSTWPFGKPANDKALSVLTAGGSGLDAIEQGINVAEADPDNPYVGLAGIPNSAGVVQLDACIMSGPGHRGGSVAGVSGYRHPISIARAVMERTKHVMLVGQGAEDFAAQHGFARGPKVSAKQRADWKKWRAQQKQPAKSHDTIAMVLLAPDGNLYGGCSTSGLAYKIPGRIGDSPILGSGLYVDNEVGAAGATGVGENVMRYCGTFLVVELMRQGMHPQEACVEAVKRIARLDPKGYDLSISFLAIDRQGRFGGVGTGTDFEYAVTTKDYSRVVASPEITGPGK